MSATTTDTAACERLNSLLIELNRSLLQYACEAWPWSSGPDGAALRATVQKLGAQQRQSVAALAELLDSEGQPVDFGVYPDEYTSLHYVSLRYLLDQLITGQESLIADCRSTASTILADTPAYDLLAEVATREEAILRELLAKRSR